MRTALVSAPWTPGLPGLVNALSHPATGTPFATIQAAIDYVAALPSKGKLYVPAGTYASSSLPALTTCNIPSYVDVVGDGQERTVFNWEDHDPDVDLVRMTGSFCSLNSLSIEGPAEDGSGVGVFIGEGGDPQRHAWIDDVHIHDTASWCFYIAGDPGTNIAILSGARGHSRFYDSHTNGAAYIGPGNVACQLDHVNMPCSTDSGPVVKIDGAFSTTLDTCTVEPSSDSVLVEWATNGEFVDGLRILGGYYETHNAAASAYAFEFTGATGQLLNALVQGITFKRYPEGTNKSPKLARATGTAQPFRNLVFDANFIYENRTGSAPTDDISISNNSHEFVLRQNVVWSRTGGLTRALACTGSTAAVLDWDYKRFMFPRISTESGYTTGLLQGAAWRHITNARTRQFTGAASQTIQAVTEAEE